MGCYISTTINVGSPRDDFPIPTTALNTYAARDFTFTAPVDNALVLILAFCNQQASGLQVLVEDVAIWENIDNCPLPESGGQSP